MSLSYDKLMQYALRLISRKRYTEQEMILKLKRRNKALKSEVEKVIKRVKELNYVNDEVYAKDYISSRMSQNPRGKHLLKIELKLKGVNKDIITNAIENANLDELKAANEVLKRKSGSLSKHTGQKKKEKIIRYLASRGFEFDTIYKVLGMW